MPAWRKQCGKPECKRQYNNERGRVHTANYAKRHPEKRRARRQRRRALERGCVAELFEPREIFERDDWTCQLCGQPVPRDACFPHPLSASIDHIVPLSRGGAHTKDNVQLAHLTCNCSARDKRQAAS
jgi:5-methylcytosine-specific restriction endonuclease McrA